MLKKILMLGVVPAILVLAALLAFGASPKSGKHETATPAAEESSMEGELPAPPQLQTAPAIAPTATTPAPLRPRRVSIHPNPTATGALPVEAAPPPAPTPTVEVIQLPRTVDNWKDWPVMPLVSEQMRQVYRNGPANGADPHAFSILGDCQSLPEVFMGVYDANPEAYYNLPPNLKETVIQFAGSFNRYSPTVKDASTAGALLWAEWNDNREGQCTPGETPIDCELRVHRPSIVLIHIGTHWEARNQHYLDILIRKILDAGAVPVLATKADNRELDERVNRGMAELALKSNLPLWNFWGALKSMPNQGLIQNSDMYLSEPALEIHRRSALEALDTVWRALKEE